MKDLFSEQSAGYAAFRPVYPTSLYDFIYSLVPSTESAWDCGTGNGQVARQLAEHFNEVYATDISEKQLSVAVQKPNIRYSCQPAESTNFSQAQFDLIVVAQAIHWFDFEKFYAEVRRTIKPEGVLAVVGYGVLNTNGKLNDIVDHFYRTTIGSFWDPERKHIDEHYKNIPFPFEEIKTPVLSMRYEWSLDHLLGYLSTWSAVQHYKKANGHDPVQLIANDVKANWGDAPLRAFEFPVISRVAIMPKAK